MSETNENRILDQLNELEKGKSDQEVAKELEGCKARAVAEIQKSKAFILITLHDQGVSGGHAGRIIDVVKCASCISKVEDDIKKGVAESVLGTLSEDIAKKVLGKIFDGSK